MIQAAEAKARRILELRKTGMTCQKIAETVGVSISTVYNILKGRTWACLTKTDKTPDSL